MIHIRFLWYRDFLSYYRISHSSSSPKEQENVHQDEKPECSDMTDKHLKAFEKELAETPGVRRRKVSTVSRSEAAFRFSPLYSYYSETVEHDSDEEAGPDMGSSVINVSKNAIFVR